MKPIDRRTVLAHHFLFSQLMPAELDRILALAHERHFSKGQIIFQKGAKDSSMMAVLQGQVKISICSADGKEIILTTVDEGSVFGEIALIDGKERSADATAQGDCRLLVIRRSDFIPVLKQHPEVAIQLLVMLCQKVRDTSDVVETVGLLHTPSRLARLLLKMAKSAGAESPEGLRVDVKSQREIGNLIGATREWVNHILRAWQEAGLIKMEQNHITILKQDELEDIVRSVW
ncbi:MAG: Crp/Fnr family transcriptional regulator [Gammaproteobacteria bacterium]